jgi:hypothetical protein
MADIAIRERNAVVYLMSDFCSRRVGNLTATMGRAVAIAAALTATIAGRAADAVATLDHAPYGTTQGGQAVDIFTMTNDHGLRMRFLSLGGVITEIDVPDPRAGSTTSCLASEPCGNTRRSLGISARSLAATPTA